jgi:hypothetical protein
MQNQTKEQAQSSLDAYLDQSRRMHLGRAAREAWGATDAGKEINRVYGQIVKRVNETELGGGLCAPYSKELFRRSRRSAPLPRSCRLQAAERFMRTSLFWGRELVIAGLKFRLNYHADSYTILWRDDIRFHRWVFDTGRAFIEYGRHFTYPGFKTAREAIRAVKDFAAIQSTLEWE